MPILRKCSSIKLPDFTLPTLILFLAYRVMLTNAETGGAWIYSEMGSEMGGEMGGKMGGEMGGTTGGEMGGGTGGIIGSFRAAFGGEVF